MDTDTGFSIAGNNYPVLNKLKGFSERISYDANGNIQKYVRNNVGDDPIMDDLTYTYYTGTNQLRHVGDKVRANKWGGNDWDFIIDIDSQAYVNNYQYDSIGNLIRDSSERIWNIKWIVYGKIGEINKHAGPKSPFTRIRYSYDASGNRIGKMSESASDKLYEWYVRDGQGNILSIYNASGTSSDLSSLFLSQVERNIYGSSRLGSEFKSQGVDGGPWDAGQYYTNGVFERGRRQYELSNHLGNVLTTISDKKFGVSSNGSLIDYYEPQMVTGTNYYPFGMPMGYGGSNTGQGYRFGFNGKENDNEVKWGMGNQQDYGMRIYDPRLGRFLSVDPITKDYPWYTPYQFAGNSPISNIDLDGLEPMKATISQVYNVPGSNAVKVVGAISIKIQILNTSSTPSKDLKLYELRNEIQQGLTNLMGGSTTSSQRTAFTTKNGKVIMLPSNNIEEHSMTYDIQANVYVSIVNNISELSPDAIPIVLVNKTGNKEAGLANTLTNVAKMDASYLKNENSPAGLKNNQDGYNIALHEISHILGADDIYDENDLDKVKTPNLMNSVKYMVRELTNEQKNNMWRKTLGAWQFLWKKVSEKQDPVTTIETNPDVQKDVENHLKN